MKHRAWSHAEDEALRRGWANGASHSEIAQRIGRTRAMVDRRRKTLALPARDRLIFFVDFRINEKKLRVYFKLPLRKSIEKLIRRVETVLEWVAEGPLAPSTAVLALLFDADKEKIKFDDARQARWQVPRRGASQLAMIN